VKGRDEVSYRLGLAQGFQKEAEQDFGLERWRSCVDNAQLAAENSGKAILALFGAVPKTHQPARALEALLQTIDVVEVRNLVQSVLPDLLALGEEEHFRTDYGDETTYTLPWELFTRESAAKALAAGKGALNAAAQVVNALHG
jgi:HEPN domain-containing protein